MLFNSFEFVFLFLPILLAVIYVSRSYSIRLAHGAMIFASLYFYALLDGHHLAVLIFSAIANYTLGEILARRIRLERPTLGFLFWGTGFNLALLGGYKYLAFIAQIFGMDFPAVAAPLGISFFTFHQLSYLVDIYRRIIVPTGIRDYLLFVTFFPHLISGPIIRYGWFAPQLPAPKRPIAYEAGIFFFSAGLFKKTVLADRLAPVADRIFSTADHSVAFWEAWKGVLAYTWQIYFDFSGYADMAIGLGLLLGIALPVNFDAPYRAVSITDFWRRWHITLSRFLRDYLYIPLGGSRHGRRRQVFALLLTMTLAGLWHGAALTFVVWGALHGIFLSIAHVWRTTVGRCFALPRLVSILLTFILVAALWVLFRAESFEGAIAHYRAMTTFEAKVLLPTHWHELILDPVWKEWLWIMAGALVVFVLKPTSRYAGYDHDSPWQRLQMTFWHAGASGILLWMSLKAMSIEPSRSFVYFVF